MPFPTSVTLSGSGLTPTISRQTPASFTPDGFRVQIFDQSRWLANGSDDIIFARSLPSNATSFTLPAGIGLNPTGNDAINFQEIVPRGHVSLASNNNADIFSRSSSFFDFAPLGGLALGRRHGAPVGTAPRLTRRDETDAGVQRTPGVACGTGATPLRTAFRNS